ncbi:MAG: 2-oxo acid dehydrogenase subunit E2, partial [Proteobacteria bacterium]|nr:2-oxo acid dehydrogenase subunit E2 [Pseudomonadota bacterium]
MTFEIKMPNVGESVQEGVIHKWRFKSGDYVNRDEVILELETDKATVEVVAENSGVIEIIKKQGETVAVGGSPTVPASSVGQIPVVPAGSPAQNLSPATRRIVEESGVNPSNVAGTGKDGRITKADVASHIESGSSSSPNLTPAAKAPSFSKLGVTEGVRSERREQMTLLRRRIAERLVHAQSTAAILTTFNEIDMSNVMKIRNDYKEKFKEKYGVGLGFMSFFLKASIEALKQFPSVNGWVDGTDIVYHDYYDIGVAVSSNRGLVVPVIKDADLLSAAQLEQAVGDYGKRAKDGKLTVDEMTGGTFTVSNGGVFGSLMSTP